jgi:hypothetical protein
MVRTIDSNVVMYGHEPKFDRELSKIELMSTLNWYTQNKDTKDAVKYANDYFKKNHKLNVDSVIKNYSTTFGFVCRILNNGGSVNEKELVWFNETIIKIKEDLAKPKVDVVVDDKPVQPNIQDRIREKASECIGELEGLLDEYILSKFTSNPKPYGIMHTLNIKGVHTNRILEHWKRIRAEYDNALTTEDELIKEGYSNFSKTEIKKIVGFCDSVITDAMKVVSEANKIRKPRQRKQKSPEQLVAKLRFMQLSNELKLESVDPKDIIGALQLWVYNTKSRKLGCYNAEDASGLSVKGSSIISFNESKSIQKKLRKPEVTLPEVLRGGKVYLRTALDEIKAVASTLNGRLNTDTILLRIIK